MGKKYTTYTTAERPMDRHRSSGGGAWKWVLGIGTVAAVAFASNGGAAQPQKAEATVVQPAEKTVDMTGYTDLERQCVKVGETVRDVMHLSGNDLARMIAISAQESSCRPNADNTGLNKDGTVDVCWAQINKTANADLFKGKNWHDAGDCAEMAAAVLKRQGWNAWSSYDHGHGAYRKQVPMGLKLAAVLS